MPRRRLLSTVAALAVLVPAAGCEVDAVVETRVEGRSGVVTVRFELDREAASVLGGRIEEGVRIEDLRRAGWIVSDARRTTGKGLVVEAAKRFGRPGDLGEVLDELAGREGPLREFRLRRDRSLTAVRYRLTGRIDLRGDRVAGFDNAPEVARRLRGAGVNPDDVEALLRERAEEGFTLRLVVDLPGEEVAAGRREAVWELQPGNVAAVRVRSEQGTPFRLVFLVVAVLLAVGAVTVWRRRSPSPASLSPPAAADLTPP